MNVVSSIIIIILSFSAISVKFDRDDQKAKVDLLEMQIENIRKVEETNAFLKCNGDDPWVPVEHFPKSHVTCPGYEND